MKITLRQLETFIALANNVNMSQAAETLCMTQSACSMSLSTLENQLNGRLFDRHGKKLFLNERGRTLLPHAMNLITQAKELENRMKENHAEKLIGHLVIGASTTIGNYLLPTLIQDFITTHPLSKITLRIGNTEQIIQQLLNFTIDIGLIEGGCYSPDILTSPWQEDKLIIITGKNSALLKKTKLSLKDLQNEKWILREKGSGTREKFEEAMGAKIEPFLELGHTEAIKQAVEKGLGISCLSQLAVTDALQHKKLFALKTPFLKLSRKLAIILHQEKHQTALLTEFIKACNNKK